MIREFLAVAARAALEWALASLLLANGAAFCLIAAAAERLRLAPPCIACARVHRLFCSSSASSATGVERDALRLLLCDAHLAAVAVASSAPPDRCDGDGVSETEAAMAAEDPNKVSGEHSSTRLILIHPLNFFALKSVVSITPIYISITQ
ncbi:unnamed protein product [Miscanthus lutarioriparius]|uniref:Uncharacterized protein n=1 Tax=Miscanthus lutarioriparius TaxID=422564 RepID=A0A811RI90_9POAL|nr:unnamed protein product [Miscanthus lutarioriparius]